MSPLIYLGLALIVGACSIADSTAVPLGPQAIHATRAMPLAPVPTAGKTNDALALSDGQSVKVTVDALNISRHGLRDIRVLARYRSLVALSDSYPSKPRGASLCQAGNETWFRIIDTAARKERYARLVDSCTTDAEWGDPPVRVNRGGAEITLNLLSEPAVTLVLHDDGQVTVRR